MNRVEVSGRLTREPEIKYLGDTRFPVLTLNVAVDDGSGRWNRETKKSEYGSGFYQVEVAGPYGERVAGFLSKGDEVYVVGSLSQFTTQSSREGSESKTHTRIRAVVCTPLIGGGAAAAPIAPPTDPLVDEDPWSLPPSGDAGKF